MAELQLTLWNSSGRVRALVPGQVISLRDQDVKRQFAAWVGQVTHIAVDAGEYLVSVALPSGRMLHESATVAEAETVSLRMRVTESPHEWLAWSTFTGDVAPAAQYEHERAPLSGPVPIWHRLWTQSRRSWSVEPWPSSWVDSDGTSWAYALEYPRDPVRLLQVGGIDTPWRFTLLPPTEHVDVVISPSRSDASFERGVQIVVGSSDHASEGLLRFLSTGSLASARTVGEALTAQAEEMLRDKIENPMGAAIGGYYLLQARAWDRMHHWPGNFFRFIDWLPDAAVIYGLQLLEHPDMRNPAAARDVLLEAVRRGLPVFTVGLRRLHAALQLLLRTHEDAELRQTLEFIESYADAADWSQPFTTFYGEHPTRPGMLSATGVPLDWSGIQFLADAQQWPIIGQFPPNRAGAGAHDPVPRATLGCVPSAQGWHVEVLGDPTTGGPYSSREQAVTQAEAVAASLGWARIIVRRDDGSIETVRYSNPDWWSTSP